MSARPTATAMSLPVDEQSFQAAVVDVGRLAGWRVAHFRPARTAKGWRTPVTADGAGWPDLVCARPPRLLFVELKAEVGTLRPQQTEWLDVLRLLPACETYVWRPSDWDALVEVLTGTAPRAAV
jgi:VRR-NUC domain